MSRNRSAALLSLIGLMLLLNACASPSTSGGFQPATSSEQTLSGQRDIRIYGAHSTSITHRSR